MTQLIEHGRQALQMQAFERASGLFREAVRRAPFRQDLKDLLAQAVEGNLQQNHEAGRSERSPASSTCSMMRPQIERAAERPPIAPERLPRRQDEPLDEEQPEPSRVVRRESSPLRPPADYDDPAGHPIRPRESAPPPGAHRPNRETAAESDHRYRPAPRENHPAEPTDYSRDYPPAPHNRSARPHPESAHFRPGGTVARPIGNPRPIGRSRPKDFGRRHQRGPTSAIILGTLMGLVLVTLCAVGWLYYGKLLTRSGGLLDNKEAQFNGILEHVQQFRNRGEYSQAIEQLKSLPDSPKRNQKLAEIYNDQGDQAFKEQPSNFMGAIDAYTNAVRYDQNPRYGSHLGEAYYFLGKEKTDTREAKRLIKLAQQSYQAVLEKDPRNLEALKMLTKVAIALGDASLHAETLNKIIDAAPDSEDAKIARRDLRSLDYKARSNR